MKYLVRGMESKEKIELLFSLTKISSEAIKSAIIDNLVNNFSVSDSANLNSCQQSNLTHAISSINKIAEIVERINECKFYMRKAI